MQRRILKMYNKSKLTVTVKCLKGAKGVQASLMVQFFNICQWTFDTVSILNLYEAALTYMISVNRVKLLVIIIICVASRQYYSYMKLAFGKKFGKNIIIITYYYKEMHVPFYHSVAINIEIDLLEALA